MKILLVAVALLVAIETEAHSGWWNQERRGNNYPGHTWDQNPQRMENQNNGFSSDVEWVCQNPRTHDMMIIAADDTRRTPQQNDRVWWQNQWNGNGDTIPHRPHREHQHGNPWNQPIIIIQEVPNTDDKNQPFPTTPGNRLPFSTTPKTPNNNNNNNNGQTESPPYNGGEGLIDIRVGDNN
ncbi:PREDICTED: uncharacterized protein LOC105458197 [Wasmannia auropunctata]|uniref:uncharacterized protein LOC105458197 n=1 Tax=Wasmannia auropunctata TaxID=64793 RepID=UPI0005EDD440|nr:PREDICTED: uncharacterized protein LOC105458197 [Wasmannia auropunctata]XP_011701627.1 PREDICTED: uncharacterized protein LOC105458197 [Wasmannia auropunctata]